MALPEVFGTSLPLLLLLLGTGLMIAEAFAPGAHLIVVGVALFSAGLVGLFLPAGLGALSLLILTGVVFLSGAATLYVYKQLDIYGGGDAGRTSDSSSLRGKLGRVTERVTPRKGEVKLDEGGFNPFYQARSVGGEIPEGEEIIVVDPGGGNVLTVESFGELDDEIDRELDRARRSGPDAGVAADAEVDTESS